MLLMTADRAVGQAAPLSGDIPAPGGFGLVSWTGGSLDQLQLDATSVGCRASAAWVTDGGEFVGFVFGAPTFVNTSFAARFPQGLAAGPLLLVCEPDAAGGSPPATPPTAARFETLPPRSTLPTGAECASRVRPTPEIRPDNTAYNTTPGTSAHDTMPRVDGNFTGTTDELIQWAACKWGIDEDVARAQVAIESWWRQTTGGDRTFDPSICHPDLRAALPCPESVGLMQVRFQYHGEAYEDSNAIRSSAYNLDYAFGMWRSCFEGDLTWLNTVERGSDYVAGDLWGCTGVWFSGRWYTQPAIDYNARVRDFLDRRIWETDNFRG